MNTRLQRLCAWAGIPAAFVFFAGMLVMSFLPPLSPAMTAEQVADVYQTYTTQIRAGAVLVIVSSMFAILFYAAISIRLRVMEGQKRPIMAYAQFIAGAANIQFFIMPGLLWVVAAFRPDRPVEITHALNDLAWIVAVLPWPITCIQTLICGIAILEYSSAPGAFPRWLGFFNIWIAVLFLPGALLPFFKTGPFAWNGLLSFWVPATVFGMWFILMQIMVLNAIRSEATAPSAA
jgi:hypothetical protein